MVKNALIIGWKGFVGRHLYPKLKEAGYEVYGTEQFSEDQRSSFPAMHVVVHLGANIVNVDARSKLGIKAYDDILLDYRVCKWIEDRPPIDAFIAMSSCAVDYPEDPYCIVKRTLEAFTSTLYKKGVPVVTLRPFSGYGPDQSEEYPFRAIFDRALRKEDPLIVWGGNQVRDWVWIDELCDKIVAAISWPKGQTYEIGTGLGTSLYDVARKIARAVGYAPQIHSDYTKATASARRVAALTVGDNALCQCTLDYGIECALEYYKKQGRNIA